MSQESSLREARVAIIGLGLMGGSLAMALRGKCAHLMGIDHDPQTLDLAQQWQIADQLADQPGSLLPQADVVILATPVRTILQLVEQLPSYHPGSAVVLDLGSTKVEILTAMDKLPERFDPIGGHPMCGKERASLVHAEATLFQGAAFAFTPLERTQEKARTLANELALAIGAQPLWLDAPTHDRWVAATSHLPYLLANALAAITPLDASPLIGPGFRSTARLAGSSVEMMLDILMTNRAHVLRNLQALQGRLGDLERCLRADEPERLQQELLIGAEHYQRLLSPLEKAGLS